MIKLTYQPFGEKLIIGIHGDSEEEIRQQYYSFYNWGATQGELTNYPNSESYFQYCWVDSLEKFKYALFQAEISKMYQTGEINSHKGKKNKTKDVARARAEERFGQMQQEKIVKISQTVKLNFHKLGNIETIENVIFPFLNPFKTLTGESHLG